MRVVREKAARKVERKKVRKVEKKVEKKVGKVGKNQYLVNSSRCPVLSKKDTPTNATAQKKPSSLQVGQ